MVFDIGVEKILLIMVVVLLLFGAKRIPEIGQSLGKGIREFRRSMSDINREVLRETLPDAPYPPRPSSSTAVERPPLDAPGDPPRAEPKRLL